MHLRLPLVIGIVAIAAVAAGVRALHGFSQPHAAGFSVSASADKKMGRASAGYPRAVRAPVPRARPITVYVAGEVAHSGVYVLPATARAVDAVHAAGGATASADLVATNFAEPLHDGQEVVLFPKGTLDAARAARSRGRLTGRVNAPRAYGTARASGHRKKKRRRSPSSDSSSNDTSSTGTSTDMSTGMGDGPTEIVDLNAADAAELETLPGIGTALAARIVSFREQSGPFGSPDDLLDVGGMTEAKLDAVFPYVTAR